MDVTWYSRDTHTSAMSAFTSPESAKSINRWTPP